MRYHYLIELAQKYSFRVQYSEEDGGYIALSPEFPGLSAFGVSPEEAIRESETALELFIETYSDLDKPLPEPNVLKQYSGQIRARLPKSLHQWLTIRAEEEGVSLNTLMIQLLSEGLSTFKSKETFESVIKKFTQTYKIAKKKAKIVLI